MLARTVEMSANMRKESWVIDNMVKNCPAVTRIQGVWGWRRTVLRPCNEMGEG